MKKATVILALVLVFAGAVSAQKKDDIPVSRRYATQAYMKQLAQQYPKLNTVRADIERHIHQFHRTGRMDTLTIPVVFHIFNTGNSKWNISPEDVEAQLAQLSWDFMAVTHPYLSQKYKNIDKKNPNDTKKYLHQADKREAYAERAGQPFIRFCLPRYAPDGKQRPAVLYRTVSAKNWGMNDSLKRTELGGSSPWDPQRYCNIWVAPLAGGAAGYAQMPGGPLPTDGVVIDPRYFARNKAVKKKEEKYREGRTLVHLLANYLNLYDLWNDDNPCVDDYVDDTPVHNAPNSDLDTYRHVSTCGENPVEMTMNLMDNTRDSAQYMFTWGQIMRMHATLNIRGPRYMLRKTPVQCADYPVLPLAETPTERGGDTTPSAQTTLGGWNARVFPNPTDGQFILDLEKVAGAATTPVEAAQIQVFNAAGVLQWQSAQNVTESLQLTINAGHWPAGLYHIVMRIGQAQQVLKVLVER
jgi:Pregnancy-associated plasma protein-A/Secretion system C-terminal sorting domain